MRYWVFLHFFYIASAIGSEKLDSFYYQVDPNSIAKQLAFYHLYPESPYSKKALARAFDLINRHRPLLKQVKSSFNIPPFRPEAIISLTSELRSSIKPHFSKEDLDNIASIASHLHNRKLPGYRIESIEEADHLSQEKIDLTKLLLMHLIEDPNERLSYDATIDLMALEILAHLPRHASNKEKVAAINQFLFHDIEYRFPPQSFLSKEIDTYTFLPSVLDSRFGVCLGVSILYLGIAERLDLPLTILTPPGHIFLSYEEGEEIINIETTARGINLPRDHYLSIQCKSIPKRTLKEVVGMSFFNQAALHWQRKEYQKSKELYAKADRYIPNDPLILRFKAFQHLFLGEIEEGRALLEKIRGKRVEGMTFSDTSIDDFLDGHIDIESLQYLYQHVDETRASIERKREALIKMTKQFPRFREGFFHLAITWLQLGRAKEALEALKCYHLIDSTNPIVEYYLSILCLERAQIKEGFLHLRLCEALLDNEEYHPKLLNQINLAYKIASPLFDLDPPK